MLRNNLLRRAAASSDGILAVARKGLGTSPGVVRIVFTGWKAWEMLYCYGVGVADVADSGRISAGVPKAA